MKVFIKKITDKPRLQSMDSYWLELYNSYYDFDNRVIKLLDLKDDSMTLEHLEGFDLREFWKLVELDVPTLRYILEEVLDIYAKQFKFRHELLPIDRTFLHLDYKPHNLMYADGRVRLVDPDSFFINPVKTSNTSFGKYIENFTNIVDIISDKVKYYNAKTDLLKQGRT